METSAKTRENVEPVFYELLRQIQDQKKASNAPTSNPQKPDPSGCQCSLL